MNQWGKTKRGEKYSDGIEFRDPNRKPFDWENKELAETLPEPEEPVYPDVLAEVPGLVLKSDLLDDDGAIMEPEEPTFEEQAAAAGSITASSSSGKLDLSTSPGTSASTSG